MWKKKEFIQLNFQDETGKQKRLKLQHFLTVPTGDDWQTGLQNFTDEGVFLDRKSRCKCLDCCQSGQLVRMKRTSIFEEE